MADQISLYLKRLARAMKISGVYLDESLAEIESHLMDSVESNLRLGLNRSEAEEKALKRFGSINVVLTSFEKERITTMQKILIGIATLAGLFSLYVDTRPTWDDTGVLVFGILFISGLLALIGYQRPWLLALAIGIWIPLHGVFISHSFATIAALVVAFVGAYSGWALRLGIRKTFRMA